jgi:hypothetical protein
VSGDAEAVKRGVWRTVVLCGIILSSIVFGRGESPGQENPPGVVVYKGIEFSVSKTEIVDKSKTDSYMLVLLRIKNTNDKPIRYVAAHVRELSLGDDRGNRYVGVYAQDVPEGGIEIYPGEEIRAGYAFQKPDLDCTTLTMSFSKNDLQGPDRAKNASRDEESIQIPIPVKRVIVRPKGTERHESEYRKGMNVDGLIFIVNEAFIWKGPAAPASMGVTFDFINSLMTKRVDVTSDFTYSLVDNLGHAYKSMRPVRYSRPLKVLPDRYPRVFPGETYQETVFFEPPADGLEYLVFTINAASVGIPKEISVKIPVSEIAQER